MAPEAPTGSTVVETGAGAGGGLDVEVEITDTQPGIPPGGGGGGSGDDDPWVFVPLGLGVDDDGRDCVVYGWVRRSAAPDLQVLGQAFIVLPACPQPPAAPVVDPGAAAREEVRRFLESVQLPTPTPSAPPGRGVTGLTAHLDAGTSLTARWDLSLDGRPLVITATSTLTVDWGDGARTGPHTTVGGPWPDGDLTHLYTDAATYTITVTQTWTARWTWAGLGGTFTTLDGVPITTTGAVVLPVDEVQAVVR